ncbi:hypothetical protein EV175_004010, partial [Coemansia sp. RSA 1933]
MDSRNAAESALDKERQRLTMDSDESRERMERILREQLDLELFLKQKEINAISENLRHGEALLKVLETAIQSLQLTNVSPEDISDGYLSYLRRGTDAPGHQQPTRRSAGMLRERPRRAAATATPKHTSDSSSGTLFAQNASNETVRMICPACQRDRFVSLQGFLSHCRIQHSLDFASYDEAIRACGHVVHGSGDYSKPRSIANSEPPEGSSRSGWALNTHALAARLDSTQLASVTDALEFINRPRVSAAESSDGGNDSDSQSTTAPAGYLATTSIASGSSKAMLNAPQARESRFHVIRRVILGNSSQYIAPRDRPSGKEKSTHKWTVYIQSASSEHQPSDYIRKVRVFLHPSYRPDDIVDLVAPDFALTRWGWGEFPVRLQVFFRDKRNKPVDLIHMLKLDDMWSGNEVLGAEGPIDFELDRRGLDNALSLAEEHAFALSRNPPPDNAILLKVLQHLCSIHPLVLADALPRGCKLPESPEQILDMVPSSVVEKWTWGVAVSEDVWRNVWPIGKRLAAEESRSRALLALIVRALPTPKEPSQGNTESVDSSAVPKGVKLMLSEAIYAILQACGSDAATAESFNRIIGSSDDGACSEALEVLKMWTDGASDPRRSISPDKARGYTTKAFAWSLRQFLRHYGLVPLPVLSSAEEKACSYLATLQQSKDGHGVDLNASQGAQSPSTFANVGSGRQSCEEYVFCNFCGVLLSGADIGAQGSSNNASTPFYCSQYCSDMGVNEYTTLSSASEALAKLPAGWDKSDDENDVDIMLTIDNSTASQMATDPGSACDASDNIALKDIQRTASLIRAYHLEHQGERDLDLGNHSEETDGAGLPNDMADTENDYGANDRAIDWIWASIRPLELSCAPASRFTETSSLAGLAGSTESVSLVQLPNCNDEAFGEALEQRVVVGRLFVDVAKLFLRDLISASDKTVRRNRAECIRANESNDETKAVAVSKRRLLMLTPLHVLLAAKRNPELFDVCTNTNLGALK